MALDSLAEVFVDVRHGVEGGSEGGFWLRT
jgi:hypothetical protein